MKPFLFILFATLIVLLTVIGPPCPGVDLPAEAPAHATFGDGGRIALSPDGRWLAYVVGDALWIASSGTDESRQVSKKGQIATAPRWSPDAKHLAYYVETNGAKQLNVWNRETNLVLCFSEARAFTINLSQPPLWSSDGKQLLFIAFTPDEPLLEPNQTSFLTPPQKSSQPAYRAEEESKSFVQVFTSTKPRVASPQSTKSADLSDKAADPEIQRLTTMKDVIVADLETTRVTRIMRGKGLVSLALAPDKKNLAVMGNWRRETDDQDLLDLYVMHFPTAKELTKTQTNRNPEPSESAVDAQGQSVVPVCKGLRQTCGLNMSWSPDSALLAFGTRGKLALENVYVVDVATRNVRNLTAKLEIPPGPKTYRTRYYVYDVRPTPKFYSELCPPLWTSNGQSLLCIGQGDVWLLPLQADGVARNLTSAFRLPIDHLLHANDGNQLLYTERGDAVLALTQDPKKHSYGICQISLTTGKTEQLHEEPKRIGDSEGYLREDVATQAGQVAFVMESSTQPPEVWLSDRSFQSPRKITHINRSLDGKKTGAAKIIRWKTTQGKDVEGYLTLPPEADPSHKVPLIVAPAAGSTGSSGLLMRFQPPKDAHGYASFIPDIPLGKGDQTDAILASVMPALDAVVATGVIDGERIGLMGHSIGGFTVNVLITHSPKFKAAVSSAGIADWTSFHLNKQRVINPGAEDMAPPWQDPQSYIKNSPIYHLDKVRTPLLLIHGTADTSVPIEQSEEMFQGLRLLGKEVELVEYLGAGHGLAQDPKVRQDRDARVFAWFDKYLKPSR